MENKRRRNMKNTYFGKGNEKIELTRSLSHGYKKAVIDESLSIGTAVKTVTEDDTLLFTATEGEYEYGVDRLVFVCKTFGVTPDIPAKVSIIFADDGNMIVTLHEGSIMVDFNGKMVQPMVGQTGLTTARLDEVLWVDCNNFLSNKAYFGSELQNKYWQDFEYVFTVTGGIDKANCQSFKLKKHKEEYIDLSLGYIATLEEEQLRKEKRKELAKMQSMWSSPRTTDLEFDIDESIDDEDFYDDEEDDLGL